MNAHTCFRTALRERSGLIFKVLLAAVTGLLLGSCATQSGGGSGGSVALGRDGGADYLSASSPRPSSPAMAAPEAAPAAEAFSKPVKERPGLATQWGDAIKSSLTTVNFTRASAKPYGVDAIYYNDAEGLKAMGADDQRVDGMQQAAGSVLEWGVRGSFGMLTAYKSWGDGRRYVVGKNGGSYSIVVKNLCKSRILVVLSVDGLDVMDGKPASVTKSGYVIDPGATLEVKGFRTGYDAVAAFRFSTVADSYANTRHGNTRNVGVIGLAAFLEKGRDPWTWMPEEIQRREKATPFATPR